MGDFGNQPELAYPEIPRVVDQQSDFINGDGVLPEPYLPSAAV